MNLKRLVKQFLVTSRNKLKKKLLNIERNVLVLYKKQDIKKVIQSRSALYLHLGCGQIHLPNWINIDIVNTAAVDLKWNLKYGFPFDDNSIDLIYSEHFLEHLTLDDGISLLRNSYKVLKTGGIIRIAMPDLEVLVDNYLHLWQTDNWKKDLAFDRTGNETACELFNIGMRSWEHKYIYDFNDMKKRLENAGFGGIKRVSWGKSDHLELNNLETRDETHLIVEATKL
jgi:predicted SAM-dependent methyltransferase